jgi:hypothetical protein
MNENGRELVSSLGRVLPKGFKFVLKRIYSGTKFVDLLADALIFFCQVLKELIFYPRYRCGL